MLLDLVVAEEEITATRLDLRNKFVPLKSESSAVKREADAKAEVGSSSP